MSDQKSDQQVEKNPTFESFDVRLGAPRGDRRIVLEGGGLELELEPAIEKLPRGRRRCSRGCQ